MKNYTDVVIISNVGGILTPAAGASVQVLGHVSQTSATIYSDDGVTTTTNPLLTDVNGRFAFHVANGRYDLKISGVGFNTFTLPDIDIHDETDITAPGETPLPGNLIFTGNNSHSGTETFTNGISTNSLTDSGLTSGNCVQASGGGLLTTVSGPCGTSSGTLTATGSPVSGNLAKWSGGTSLTNADLTGDVTTSGGVATTLASIVSAGTNTKITYSAKGLVTSSAQAQFTDIGGTASVPQIPNLSASIITSGTFTSGLIPAINLAGTGAGGITGNLPVGNIAPGSSGQCINTVGSTTVWGSCAGTAGEQLLSVNTTPVTVNANTTGAQQTISAASAIVASALNTLNKTIRLTATGIFNPVNNTEQIALGINVGIGSNIILGTFVPNTSGTNYGWNVGALCTTTTTGSSGVLTCMVMANIGPTVQSGLNSFSSIQATTSTGNLTTSFTPVALISFGTASTSNSATGDYFLVEQLN
jgi:hypothetical protein